MAVPADELAPDGAPAEDARARPTPDDHRPAGTGTRAAWRWAALFALPYLLLGAAWVASNPPSAAPDENHHLIKALGMGRLDIGEEYDEPLPAGPPLTRRNLSITRLVEVPVELAPDGYACFAFRPAVTADCLPDGSVAEDEDGDGEVVRDTPIGAYPPFTYVGMGLAARAQGSPAAAFYAARVVVLASCLALIVAGAWYLVRDLGPAALVGGFVALTPMALFTSATVTSSGIEITSAVAVAAIAVACLRRPGALSRPGVQLGLAVTGSVLVLSRQMGIVTLAVLLGIVAVARRHELWALVRSPRPAFVASVLILAASSAALVAWELAYDHPVDTGSPVDPAALDDFLARGDLLVKSAVGTFGWLDTPLPVWAVWAWGLLAVVVVGLGLVVGDRRDRAVLATGLAATAATAYGTYAAVFHPVGADSQGRHMLPFFVICPLYAGAVVVERVRAGRAPAALRLLPVVVGLVAGGVQLVALYANGRRYAVGLDGPLAFLGDERWHPPLGGWAAWLTVGGLGALALVATSAAATPEIGAGGTIDAAPPQGGHV